MLAEGCTAADALDSLPDFSGLSAAELFESRTDCKGTLTNMPLRSSSQKSACDLLALDIFTLLCGIQRAHWFGHAHGIENFINLLLA